MKIAAGMFLPRAFHFSQWMAPPRSGAAEQDAGLVPALYLAAADADIAPPVVRILRDPERREIGAGVLFRRPDRDRQRVQIDLVAGNNHFLARAFVDDDGLDRMAMPSMTFSWMAAKSGSQPMAVAIISRDAATTPATTRPPGYPLMLAKADAVAVPFGHRAENHPEDGRDLPVLVDFLVDPAHHARCSRTWR